MKTIWILSVFLVFTAEVRVKASSSSQPIEVLSAERSLIEKNLLLSGQHWVRKTQKYTLQTPYAEIQSKRGDFFVEYSTHKVWIVNHLGDLKIFLKDGRIVEVPPGFEIWIGEIQEDKTNAMGFIAPVEMRTHVEKLGSLWNHDLQSFKNEVINMQSRWGDRPTLAAQYYKGLAQRKMASVEEKQNQVQANRKKELDRRAANRKLLFERVFGR